MRTAKLSGCGKGTHLDTIKGLVEVLRIILILPNFFFLTNIQFNKKNNFNSFYLLI